MQDIRIERWAHTLVHYCLYVQAGETVAIRANPLASPLVEAVFRELLRVGAYPLPLIELESFEEMLLKEGNDNQLSMPHPVLHMMAEHIHAQLSIGSKSNTRSLSGVDPSRLAKRRQASQHVAQVLRKREQSKTYRWATTLYPTAAYVWVSILVTGSGSLHRSATVSQRLRAECDALGHCASDALSAPGLS